MKVAVFTSHDEVIVLAVKGRGRSVEDVDGYDEWFTDSGRDITEYSVTLCHIGAGSGVLVKTEIKTDFLDNRVDIDDWFYCSHCEGINCTCEG